MDTTMELDDLKQAWQTLDKRIQQQNTLQLAQIREIKFDQIKSRMRPLMIGQTLQMLFGIGMMLVGVALWKTFTTIIPIFMVGLLLHAYGIATMIAAGVVLSGIARIDSSLPLLQLQQRLAKLRRAYIISGAVAGLPWWLLWVLPPAVIASLNAANDSATGLSAWVWACLVVGVLGLLASWAFHRWLHRPGREALAKRMTISAAGDSLRKAQADLDALETYAEE